LSRGKVGRQLHEREGNGVLITVSDREIIWVDQKGRNHRTPIGCLKDRVSRQKRTIRLAG
jgi:hypothetical protein